MRMSKKIPIAGAPTRSVGRKGTLANCLSMGMEPATHTGKADARRGASGDGVGPTYRNGSPVLYVGRSARRVWPVEVRWRGGTSVWSFHSRCLHLAGGWKTPLSSRSQPVVERSTPRECLYPACRLPRLPDRLPALCFAGAVLGIRSQRRSGASRQRRPPSLAPTCRGFAQACQARTNTLGGCSGSSTSSHLDCPLARTIRRGTCTG